MSYKEACFDDCSVTHLQFKEFVEALGCPWEHSISCPFLATCLKIHICWEERVYWHRVTTVTVSIQHLGRNAYWQADNMLWNRKGSHRLLEVRNPFLLFKTGINLQRGLFSLSCHTAEIFCCCLVEQEIIYLSFIPRDVIASYVEVWTRLALLMQETCDRCSSEVYKVSEMGWHPCLSWQQPLQVDVLLTSGKCGVVLLAASA